MKRFIAATAILICLFPAARAAEPGALTILHAMKELTNADAAKGLPVAFEATVTYYNRTDIDLFVQDGTEAVYVETKSNQELAPGDVVMVRGKTRASFRPDVLASSITRLRTGSLPEPVAASFGQLERAQLDCMRVTVHAIVRSADKVNYGTLPSVDLKLLMDGGYIDAAVIGGGSLDLKGLLDSEVAITGVAAGVFDSKSQLTGIILEVPNVDGIQMVKPAAVNPDLLPVTPMDTVLSSYSVRDLTSRVHVQGTITYYQPGSALVLQNGARSLWIMTHFEGPLHIGDWADVTGFPAANGASLTMMLGEIQDSQVPAPVAVVHISGAELASGSHAYDLASVEGKVVTSAREGAQDEYVLTTDDGKIFSAVFRHPENTGAATLPPMKQAEPGSRIRVTGICMLQYGSDPFHGPVAVELLLRSPDDVALVSGPTLMNVSNLAMAAGALAILVLLASIKGWTLDRKMRRQTAELAYMERRRSRILEDISGTRPLAEIIEGITELVSFNLKGAPSWCQIAEGAQLGNCPHKLDEFRIVEEQIAARSGSMLGIIYVALDPLIKPGVKERETLAMATALSALAIETRRLYSDLRRRSEFDLLTDTHNRFSLDKHLDALIAEAREAAGIFGLIYIDLNEFKQVNDVYGHQTGDLYLREVALRMKRQLRPFDTLARLGGDEFAVLVPIVRSRAEVVEIANRLERSFDEAFEIDGYEVRGSASLGIALYPQDGTTKDDLLNTADTAMYSAKHARR